MIISFRKNKSNQCYRKVMGAVKIKIEDYVFTNAEIFMRCINKKNKKTATKCKNQEREEEKIKRFGFWIRCGM